MDYAVIGAGIIGCSIARELAIRKKGRVVVFEKEKSAGLHTSGRNSGVIHSGINQKPGTLKARLCVEGSRLMREYCRENGIPMEECGTIVVANNSDEQKRIRELEKYALECCVPSVRILSHEELKEREPFARGLEGLFSPTGAIVDSKALMAELVKDAESRGVEFQLNTEVNRIGPREIETSNGTKSFDLLVNCAGLRADILAHIAGFGDRYKIIPFRGDYREIEALVNGMIYPVPDMKFPFLGVHLTRKLDGNVIAGPTATLSFSGREGYMGGINKNFLETIISLNFWTWAGRTLIDPDALMQVAHNLKISNSEEAFMTDVSKIYDGKAILKSSTRYMSGIRPQIVDRKGRLINDFLIERSDNQIHLLNAVSPGLTASLAFAQYVVGNYIDK